jgi:3'-5' exoribonuclease
VEGHALLVRADVKRDRAGRDYLAATFLDHAGKQLDGRWWRYIPRSNIPLASGTVYLLTARVDLYHGVRQLSIIDLLPRPELDPGLFARTTTRSLEVLTQQFDALLETMALPWVALVRAVFADERLAQFRTWPAAKSRHGAVRHGLFAHSLLTAQLADALPIPYAITGLSYDRDLVVTACLLHDVGKVLTLPPFPGGAPSAEAELFDHVTLSVLLVRNAADRAAPKLTGERLNALLNAILTHHGRKEWGAPMEPGTPEGCLVHLADYCESRLWGWSGEEVSGAVPATPSHGGGLVATLAVDDSRDDSME